MYNARMDRAVARIIDANLNRAREGLRVLEEYARMVLDDEALARRIKELRHAVGSVAEAFGPAGLLSARDIEHDVGTGITTDGEQSRLDASHVAIAAAKRAAESLRAIEEFGKIERPEVAAHVEQARYALYAVEQEIGLGGPRRLRLKSARLHVLVTEALCRGPWLATCEQAITGGADVIQLREKDLGDRELAARARALREVTRERGVLLVINDRPDVARLVDADGVHVGREDLAVADARSIVGPNAIVGTSTHSVAEAQTALSEHPDYLAVGPMFSSGTKPGLQPAGPGLLSQVSSFARVPVVAIGGIEAGNVSQLSTGGTAQVAVCQAVVGSPDPAAAARELKRLLGDGSRAGAG